MAALIKHLLGFRDELVGIVPVLQEVSGLFIINTDIVVLEKTREEVIDLPRHIQDVTNPAEYRVRDKINSKFTIQTGCIDYTGWSKLYHLPTALELIQIGCIPL